MPFVMLTGRLVKITRRVKAAFKEWWGSPIESVIIFSPTCSLFTSLVFTLFAVDVMRSCLSLMKYTLTSFRTMFLVFVRGKKFGSLPA